MYSCLLLQAEMGDRSAQVQQQLRERDAEMNRLWKELRVRNIIHTIIIYLFSVITFTPIENCAIIFVTAQEEKILIGQKIQKLQNLCKVYNSSLIDQ